MPIPVEELAAGVVESVAGPWGIALGLGAVGILALAGGRSATSGSNGSDGATLPPATPSDWLGRLREDWRALVDEARSEHAGGRTPRLAYEVAMSENGAAMARGPRMTRSTNGTGAR